MSYDISIRVMVGLYIPWEEIFNVAENAPGVAFARDVTALGCRLRRDRPWLFQVASGGTAPIVGVSPLFSNFFWSRICALFPPSPGDAQCEQFFGGQCEDVQYIIKIFDGNGQEVGQTAPAVGSATGPLTCIKTSTGPTNFFLDVPPIPTSYQVSGVGKNGSWSRGTDTKVATPRRDTRLFTYQIVPPPGVTDNCGNSSTTINLPPVPPSNTATYEISILGQRRNVTINLPEYDVTNWPDFNWQPIIEFDGIRAEFGPDGVNIDLPDNVSLIPLNPVNNVVNNIDSNVQNIGGTVNNINSTTQTISNTVNNTEVAVNNILNTLQQEFEQLNEQLAIDIQAILDAIERCCCKEGVTLQTQVLTNGSPGGRFALPPKTVAVVFELQLPETSRTPIQEGSGSAARVYHWGSYSIGYSLDCEGDRTPLQWERQAVAVQPYATNVTIWPTYLNVGSITAIYEVPPT